MLCKQTYFSYLRNSTIIPYVSLERISICNISQVSFLDVLLYRVKVFFSSYLHFLVCPSRYFDYHVIDFLHKKALILQQKYYTVIHENGKHLVWQIVANINFELPKTEKNLTNYILLHQTKF